MQMYSKTWSSKNFVAFSTVILLLFSVLFIRFSVFDAAAACITYSSSSKTITVTCTAPTRLTDVNNVLKNPSILKKESGGSGPGVWLLAANLVVAKGGNFVIDSTDTTWLKIRSDGSVAFGLLNYGNLSIKSVKISSWNTASNNYASPGSNGNTPRAYIVAKSGATGKMNIDKSHLMYLGYAGSGHHGLDYYGSSGSYIQYSEIDHNYRAFYSSGVGYITFTGNTVHDNIEYGIDPHSGTHHMSITYNKVYNNNHGIICSVMCSFIQIRNNELYNNQRDGIFLDAGSRDSTIANNIIHDEPVGIQLPSLSYSKVYGNKIYNSKYGIELETQIGSSFDTDHRCGSIGCVSINNDIHSNNIKATSIGIWLKDGASSNTIRSNTIDGPNGDRGIVVDGSKTSGNVFSDNHISNAKYSVRLTGGNINSKFINNHLNTVASSGEYTLAGASWLKVESTQFSSDVMRSLDSSSNKISISKSGTISVIDGLIRKNYDTNTVTYTKTLASNAKIIVTSSSTSTTSALRTDSTISGDNSASISSIADDQNNSSATTERSQLDNEKNSNNPNSVVRQSAQQQAKRAQDLAGQQVTNKKEINNEAKHTESSKSNAEQNQTPDKLKSNNDNLPADHAASNEGPKHQTVLTLTLIKEKGDKSYILAGKIWDRTEKRPLQGMSISFTADSPIKIVDETTNKEGAFRTNTLSLPSIAGTYKVQGHFAYDKYEPANSNIVTIKVDEDKSPGSLLPPNQREVEDKNLPNIEQSEQKTFVNATTHGPE